METLYKFWRNHSLSIILFVILFLQILAYIPTSYKMWKAEQQSHKEGLELIDYWNYFATEMNVSMLADTYGAILLVILTKKFREKDSEESKDTNDERNDSE